MQGLSRASLQAALASYEQNIAGLPGGAGSGEVSAGLYAVADLLDREPSLRRAFTDPASSPESRRGLAERLLGQQLAPLPLRVFLDLVSQRWSSPADLRDAVETVAATAALRAAEGDGTLDDVEDELFRFARLLEREPALRGALTDPGLPDERKSALLAQLLDGRTHVVTRRLIEISVLHPRGRSLEASLDRLSQLAAQRRERYVASVRVARPLPADQEAHLATSLARLYGREVQLQIDVDPSVLGGVEVRVGDEVLDGTVARRLETVHRRLAG
jgi:F-type H+-transporting ATPase subunit delta